VELHRRAAEQAGHGRLPVSVNSHGYIAETREQAAEDAYPAYALMMTRIGAERGWRPMDRQDFDAAMTLRGANFVGSPQDVIDKILFQHEIFRHDRFLLQITVGAMPHDKVLRSIELFATEVAPAVREATAAVTA
jgi:alkanesulfonate monooxygenase SsuD/methylene tetrahydromethanopterin reductase-like flavin-dependent oxidoreductase (luciferase family)